MNKEKLETLFRSVGLQPVSRERHGDYDIFFGDGFSRAPHLTWQGRGEIQPGEHPMGAHVTFWWIGRDEKLLLGRPMFFAWTEYSRASRINAARKDALEKMKRLHNARPRTVH